jgi:hypothetical protein
VEVQGNKSVVESLKEDVEGLKRLIKEHEERADFHERNRSSTAESAKSTTVLSRQAQSRRYEDGRLATFDPASATGAMSITEASNWTRQIGGAVLLSGLAAVWYLGSSFI